jgi:hypothetical protein
LTAAGKWIVASDAANTNNSKSGTRDDSSSIGKLFQAMASKVRAVKHASNL